MDTAHIFEQNEDRHFKFDVHIEYGQYSTRPAPDRLLSNVECLASHNSFKLSEISHSVLRKVQDKNRDRERGGGENGSMTGYIICVLSSSTNVNDLE